MTNNVSHKDKKPSKNIGDARLLEIFSLYSLWYHMIFINFYMIFTRNCIIMTLKWNHQKKCISLHILIIISKKVLKNNILHKTFINIHCNSKCGFGKIFCCFWRKSLMLNKATFILSTIIVQLLSLCTNISTIKKRFLFENNSCKLIIIISVILNTLRLILYLIIYKWYISVHEGWKWKSPYIQVCRVIRHIFFYR